MSVAPGARCANHAEVAAVEICQRCGTFVCGDCLEIHEEQPLCLPCFNRKKEVGPASARATVSVVLGAVGVLCNVCAVPAIVLALLELRSISRGEAPVRGRPRALAGLFLGCIGAAILGTLVLISMFARG